METSQMNNVKVLFFATFRDKVGKKEISISINNGIDVGEFKNIIFKSYPVLEPHRSSVLVAVNKDFAFDEDVIPENAEIAMFPPVSGGSDMPEFFQITDDEIDFNLLVEKITLPSTGAVCFFTGMVREITIRGKKFDTEYLSYEAYGPMAEEKMKVIAGEIRSRWEDVIGIVMVQRIGELKPGTPTVMIGCSAAHRDTGVFEAAKYGIDRLKEIVPVWKKEVGKNGEVWIEGHYHPSKED